MFLLTIETTIPSITGAKVNQAFELYFRDPRYLERLIGLHIPQAPNLNQAVTTSELHPRLSRARPQSENKLEKTELELEASAEASAQERLMQRDFEAMSPEEFRAGLALRIFPHYTLICTQFDGTCAFCTSISRQKRQLYVALGTLS